MRERVCGCLAALAVLLPAAALAQTVIEVTPAASAVTASTSDTNLPGNTVDDNLTTRWSGNGDGAWIQLDLGTIRVLQSVGIAVYNGNGRRNRFDVQVSTGGGVWSNVLTGAQTSGTTTAEESFDMAGASARYVRYVGHGATLNAGGASTWNSLSEVSLFAAPLSATATPTPSPTSTPVAPATPTPTPAGDVDITPGAAGVTASTNDGNLPANTVDNDLTTRWSANGDGQWITFDLGTIRTVSRVSIAFYNGNLRQSRFDLQVSSSGSAWTSVLTGALSGGTSNGEQAFDFPDTSAQYVRYLGHGNTVNLWNSLTEVSLFGASCPGCATPTPTSTPTAGPTTTPTPTPSGTTFLVSSISEMQSRINSAAPGHRIVLRNGTYSTSGAVSVSGRNGTATSPIVIAAESVGGVTLGGAAGFDFSSSSHVTVEGFRFTHASTQNLAAGSHHLRFTRNVFQLAGSVQHYMAVSGDDCAVDRNTFQNKSTVGVFLTVRGPSGTMAQRTHIHRNYFLNHSYGGSNGGEGVQIGLSGLSLIAANTIVELNLFERMNGDPEAISVKSSNNTVRYNTVRNSKGCLVLRHGNNSTVAGNFVLDSDCGIRFYGNDHRIYNNYVSGVRSTPALETGWGAAITIGSGAVEDHLASHSAELRKVQDRPDRVRVSFNTLVDNFRHIGGENRTYAPRDCVIGNNIIQGDSGTFVVLSNDPPINFLWEGNILWGGAAAGNIPSSGYRRADPLLTLVSGVYRLAAGSPAIDTSLGSYAEVTVDMDGQSRGSLKDVGADEHSTASVVRRPLTPADVGPSAP